MNRTHSIKTMMIISLFLLSAITVASADDNTQATVFLEDIEITEGETKTCDLKIKDVAELGSFNLTITWDPNIVNLTDVSGTSQFTVYDYIDHTSGFSNMLGFSENPINGLSTMAKLEFKAVGNANDKCNIDIEIHDLLEANNSVNNGPPDIDYTIQDGEATITESGNVPPSNGNGDDPFFPGGGGGGGNIPPTADASAGEPYTGFVNEQITFDGSASSDSDGNITTWFWDFGDGSNASGKIVTHSFTEKGNYTVTLTVTDNADATGDYETTAVISKANNPPSQPTINGPSKGSTDAMITYSFTSSDEDNDDIRYIIKWGDDSSNTTEYAANNTAVNASHSWMNPGLYTITCYAEDDQNAQSSQRSLLVMIDVNIVFIDDDIIEGYLVDENMDDIFDVFHNNATSTETTVEVHEDGSYLIDSDDDGAWDYTYNLDTSILAPFSADSDTQPGDNENDESSGFMLFVLAGLIGVILVAIGGYWYFSENKNQKSSKKNKRTGK